MNNINLVPDTVNPSPDYYCTWQTQLFATSDGKPEKQRAIISSRALFDKEKPYGWAYFYENVREDLILVMDDSWDVPLSGDTSFYGSLILSNDKFPGMTLEELNKKIKSLGWKGLGGWICAQESAKHQNSHLSVDYWTERLSEANKAGISYWKVDWGKSSRDISFRKMLTEQGKIHVPSLTIEHAVVKDIIPHCDVFRTYDVPAIMSIPMTMEKLADVLSLSHGGLINCEDEAYIAAAGGFTMGIMRHPYSGTLPNGNADMSFPHIHRNLKTKMYEVIRAVRWHRIAPAFKLSNNSISISSEHLSDTWEFINKNEEIEEWWFKQAAIRDFINNDTLTKTAPAFISRNTGLPNVVPDENGLVPYVVASKNPNGAFSIVTCGRTIGRSYIIPKCNISVNVEGSDTVGIFGEYKNLILENTGSISKVLIQDPASDSAFDITCRIHTENKRIIKPGEIIHTFGTMSQPEHDTSEPGVIIKLITE